jgi:hypothetical protein
MDRRLSDAENRSCLESLRATNPRQDKKRIEQEKGGPLKDSYSWVLQHYDFQQWHDAEGSRLLWIKGNPGKGKTMFINVFHHLSKNTTQRTISPHPHLTHNSTITTLEYQVNCMKFELIRFSSIRHQHHYYEGNFAIISPEMM